MATNPLRVGLMFRQQEFPIDVLRRVWRSADDAGFDHLWGFDHLFSLGSGPTMPVFDGWTILATMAEVTERVGIGLMVTGNLYRHPGMLAKAATTVDHLSAGRLNMGLGAGWTEQEFQMMGMPFPAAGERIERLDEACTVLKLLWTEERATFSGRHYQLRDAIAEPKPIQRPHPPLWLGGSGPRKTLRVVATHADVWNAPTPYFEANVESSRILDDHCAAIGRDPASIRRAVQVRWAGDGESVPQRLSTPTAEADLTCRTAEAYIKAGFRDIVFMITFTGSDVLTIASRIARDVLPRMRSLGEVETRPSARSR